MMVAGPGALCRGGFGRTAPGEITRYAAPRRVGEGE
jgi:hypothetical protein